MLCTCNHKNAQKNETTTDFTAARTTINNVTLDEERALYGLRNAWVEDVTFAGPTDGESALKECLNVDVSRCDFDLRYPFWHTGHFSLADSELTENCRAALWYAHDGRIERTKLGGIKAVRECDNIELDDCDITSTEFGWKSRNITLNNSRIKGEYPFLDASNVTLRDSKLEGKYSFQYVDGLVIENSVLDTKDAFWHAKNVVVRDSVIKGEYLGWYSQGLTLINCRIEGTQPLCYAKDLTLVNCTMVGCDLAFENSEVEATIVGYVDSIKNPLSGRIVVDSVGEVVREGSVHECRGEVLLRI